MAEFSNNAPASAHGDDNQDVRTSSKSKTKSGKVSNTSALVSSIEDAQVDELYEMDDWGELPRLHDCRAHSVNK